MGLYTPQGEVVVIVKGARTLDRLQKISLD